MQFMARFRVLTKILSIIAVLSLISGAMAWLGISSLASVSERSDTMARSAQRSLLATRANNNVVAMNRAEFRSALDPRDENRLAARAIIDEQARQLEERIAEVAKTRDEKTQALMPAVTSALTTYQAQMKQTLQSVEEQGAATQEISRNVQQAAQGTMQVSSNITDVQRGATETGSASTQVLSAARMLSGDSTRLKSEVSKFLTNVRAA